MLEPGQLRSPETAVLAAPAFVNQLQWHGIEIQRPFTADLLGDDQAGVLEHVDVLEHADAAHLELLGHLAHGAARPGSHDVEDVPARLAGQRDEHGIKVGFGHGAISN